MLTAAKTSSLLPETRSETEADESRVPLPAGGAEKPEIDPQSTLKYHCVICLLRLGFLPMGGARRHV